MGRRQLVEQPLRLGRTRQRRRRPPVDESDGGGGRGDDDGTSGDTHFVIRTVADSGDFRYAFTVDGTVTRDTSNGDDSAETNNDSISDNGDGTYTVTGRTGNGYGDSYHYLGSLSNWSGDVDESYYTLYCDGTEIQPSDIS
ncbi:hypothetical protein BRC81_11185 [Halobacteriales archaeon QS_1_68_20]|nr:MAG: hypothetical protein BRC81_11185 [Halobacteriales archaeon QS_1_68_20]